MATIQSVKLCNINIDDGDKLIPYNTFNFRSLLSLFLLENGGGKTTFIHLLLQVVLPNTSSGKRLLEDTLQPGKNGFIIVEWRLDKEGKQCLITGFSFESRKEAGTGRHSLRYYMYLIEYPKGQFSIDDLPVYTIEENKKYVTSYEDFRNKIKAISKVPVQVFNSKEVRKYQDELHAHGILPEEWEDIKRINVSEGAADKFFEKTDNVPKLLERLFIPSLESALFPGDETSNTLTVAFNKFKDNLLRIPEIQKNIEDFSVVEDNVEAVIKSVESYENVKQQLSQKKDYLLRLAETYHTTINNTMEQLHNLNETSENLKQKANELNWKLVSFEVFQQQNRLKRIKEQLSEARKNVVEIDQLKTSTNREKRELQAMRTYVEMLEISMKLIKVEEQIVNLKNAEDDETLKENLELRHKEASFAWIQRKDNIQASIKQLGNDIQSHEELQDVNKNRGKELRKELDSLAKKEGEINTWFNQLEQKKDKVREWFDEWELLTPSNCLEPTKKELQSLYEQRINLFNQLKLTRVRQTELVEQKIKFNEQKNIVESEIKDLNKNLNFYHEEQFPLKSQLSTFGLLMPTNQKTLDEVKVTLATDQNDKEEELEKYKDKVRHISEDLSRLTDSSYFVPHSEIERVKRYLEDKNVYVVLGSEWLLEQKMNEDQKKLILQNIPLLPYAILVEQPQIKDVSRELAKKSWTSEIPLIFIEKDEITKAIHTDYIFELGLSLSHENTWVYQNIDTDFFVDREKIEQLIKHYQNKLEDNNAIVIEVKGKLRLLEETQRNLNAFFDKYTFEYQKDVEKQLDNFQQKKRKINKELADIASEESSLTQKLSDIETDQNHNEKDIKRVEDKKRAVQDFVEEAEKIYLYDTTSVA